jgi:hypothetical protein
MLTERIWCPWRESDPRPLPYQGSALPLSHMGVMPFVIVGAGDEVRTRDILLGRQVLYQLSYTRTMQNTQGRFSPTRFTATPTGNHFLVEGAGFEPAYSERTDLQSVAFNHSATPPKNRPRLSRFISLTSTSIDINLVPGIGIELMTFALQVRCSTN